ncbi:TonB-dependent receptor domain-containing protein [Sphingosinicella sp. BN140058]|uniref:TonB-dependent receptor domain-containing protein n=1 Tax=Sphingosinicella sp. BN140058 TaxID=1892855 RepID=UPI0010139823|nr:TonB-dependent receptor [Sphingosinicella sp. BN140058]QAY77424.1 TonB-dependent receptor [Sphingosinicella sp. BN140058]
MRKYLLLFAAAPFALVSPALAETASVQQDAEATADKAPEKEVFSTGVAKGRDRLDSATSTSSLRAAEIEKFGARSLAEILRNIPGIRAEAVNEGNSSYSIRGLPLASSGAKFLQFQEDGLPVLEFGDMSYVSSDLFLRADFNLGAVEAIRGGSASTFASNSPGGLINFISKTGDVEGGAVQVTKGLDYGENRVDFDYGSKISDTLRFHIGGFYRSGEGPRQAGYTAWKGGQVKLNVTKQFEGGYVRLYAKLLDDRTPAYLQAPVAVTGTNSDPDFKSVANFDIKKDSLLSRNITNVIGLDGDNNLYRDDARDGMHAVSKTLGLETQFDVAGWSISEKFRYADNRAQVIQNFPATIAPAAILATTLGGPGARLSYATGPNAGQAIADPASLNGNGLLSLSLLQNFKFNSTDNVTNDIRASRVWDIAGGDFTTTAGFYKSRQSLDADWLFASIITDVRGDGDAALINVTSANGVRQTQDGYFAYSAVPVTTGYRRKYDVEYDVSAPYASINFHKGKIAIGGSIRYDIGKVNGSLYGSELGAGRVGVTAYDINQDGVISAAESRTGILPLTNPAPVDYDYDYLSYSAGINFRIAEPLAVFARYSRGGRAAADRILFTSAVSPVDGSLTDPKNAYDAVKQSELGLKFRKSDFTINVTGFLADTGERNLQINTAANGSVQVERIIRKYQAKGVEFEGGYRHGPFSLTAGATYTDAEIKDDEFNPTVIGNRPRHQANFIFQATPQVTTDMFTVGANFVGTTSSYAQDTNLLKMPGYTLVGAFLQFRPTERVQLSLNANNLFDKTAFVEVTQAAIPASGIVTARALNGRTISTSLRFAF